MPWMSRWPRKTPRQTSTADEATDTLNIESLLAEATEIIRNPDAILVQFEETEVLELAAA